MGGYLTEAGEVVSFFTYFFDLYVIEIFDFCSSILW